MEPDNTRSAGNVRAYCGCIIMILLLKYFEMQLQKVNFSELFGWIYIFQFREDALKHWTDL